MMVHFDVIKASSSWALVLFGIVVFVIQKRLQRKVGKESPQPFTPTAKQPQEFSEDAYYNIEPLADLDLPNEPPLKLRTFKPKYHLTMALENTTMSDLVAMDNTYATRIQLRKDLIRDKKHDVLAYNPAAIPAIQEFYVWLVTTYLPRRLPTMYTLRPDGLFNSVTNLSLPLQAPSAEQALTLMGTNIDDDFLFLLPCPETATTDAPKYKLEAFITCFPSGFSTRSKLNLSLAAIHSPVPSYGTKLEKSMDRFFAALPVGRIVKRHNWTITTHTNLHALSGNHFTADDPLPSEALAPEEEEEAEAAKEAEEIDMDETLLRCERQTLHRLPQTKALVFAFKTYTYPIREVRDEGSGPALAEAIEGMDKGNAPLMAVYKRQVVWGKKVGAFLRRGGGGGDGDAC